MNTKDHTVSTERALDLALEALEIAQNNLAPSRGSARVYGDGELWDKYGDAITAIKQARSAPVQEPVLMFYEQEWEGKTSKQYQWLIDPFELPTGTKLYPAPTAAQRQSARSAWVGLTDEDKLHIEIMGGKSDVMLAEMVEAKLKAKNFA